MQWQKPENPQLNNTAVTVKTLNLLNLRWAYDIFLTFYLLRICEKEERSFNSVCLEFPLHIQAMRHQNVFFFNAERTNKHCAYLFHASTASAGECHSVSPVVIGRHRCHTIILVHVKWDALDGCGST